MSGSLDDLQRQVHFGHYAVAFFDILSQRALLEALRTLPTTPEESERFVNAAKKTVGTVCEFRRTLLEYVRSFSTLDSRLKPPSGATSAQIAAFDEHRRVLLKTQSFADTCLLYFAFPPEVSHGLKSLYGMILGVGFTQLLLLSARVAARGSIEVDIGTDAIPDEVYGPVLARAYQLESEVAGYPRIVVGPGFEEFLESLKARRGTSLEDGYSREMASAMSELVTKDGDGQLIVHYLGPRFCAIAKVLPVAFPEIATKAYAFVSDSLVQFTAAKNLKLTERYRQLAEYFRPNIERWSDPRGTWASPPGTDPFHGKT